MLLRRWLTVYNKEDLYICELLFSKHMKELHNLKDNVLCDHLREAFRREVAHKHGYIGEYILTGEVYLLEPGLYIPTETSKRVFKCIIAILKF